jgi:putative transposase
MSYWRLFYHVIFAAKNWAPLILPEMEPPLVRMIQAKVYEMGGILHGIGGIETHLHLVVSIPPTIPVAEYIGKVKGSSSHFVNTHLQPGCPFYWQREYGVLSISETHLPVVVRYVTNQRQHHTQKTIQETLERF